MLLAKINHVIYCSQSPLLLAKKMNIELKVKGSIEDDQLYPKYLLDKNFTKSLAPAKW